MANEGYSILDVINDEYGVILTRTKPAWSVAFHMYNPECHSLHRTDLEERNAPLPGVQTPPSGSFVHKQDVFLKGTCSELEGDSFIDKAEQRHFSAVVSGTWLSSDIHPSGLSSWQPVQCQPVLPYRERLHVSDWEKLTEFWRWTPAIGKG